MEDVNSIHGCARWFDELHEHTEGHGLTGASRSAIQWARRYLHHQRLGWRRTVDRLVLGGHRLLGYGHRFFPAGLTLVAIAAVVAIPSSVSGGCEDKVGQELSEQYCVGDLASTDPAVAQAVELVPQVLEAVLSTVLVPTRLVRLNDAGSPLPYFAAPWDAVATTAITVTFLFMLLGLRNYYRVNDD